MYGIPIPDNFKEGRGLLHLADLLLMEALKQEAVQHLTKNLTTENYLETSQTAELHSVGNLITSCAEFVFEKVNDVNWKEMEKLPKVMSAFVKIAKKEKAGRKKEEDRRKKEEDRRKREKDLREGAEEYEKLRRMVNMYTVR